MDDGTTSPAKGHGIVCIFCLKLKSILHVPGLRCNLLSVHKITQDMNCCVTFFPSYCLFHNQVSGRTIGNAKAKDGLYYLTEDKIFPSTNKAILTATTDAKILLWIII